MMIETDLIDFAWFVYNFENVQKTFCQKGAASPKSTSSEIPRSTCGAARPNVSPLHTSTQASRQLPTLMLLTRSLPPHFLLPAWGTRQLLSALQRAHQSTSIGPEDANPTSTQFEDERSHDDTPSISIRHFSTWKGSGKPLTPIEWTDAHRAQRKAIKRIRSQLEDERSHEKAPLIHRAGSGNRSDKSLNPTGSSSPRANSQQSHIGTSMPPLEEKTKPTSSLSDNKRPSKGTTKVWPEGPKRIGSLFDELFPEEGKSAKQREKKTVDKLPVFEWHDGPEIDWKETVEKAAEERKNWFHMIPEAKAHIPQMETEEKRRKRDLGVLVLSSASKTLEESDFFRLGEKGEHIEGWTSGIVKGKSTLKDRRTYSRKSQLYKPATAKPSSRSVITSLCSRTTQLPLLISIKCCDCTHYPRHTAAENHLSHSHRGFFDQARM
jgi:hypothetical protein